MKKSSAKMTVERTIKVKKSTLYAIIVVLVAIIAIGGTYIVMSNTTDNKNTENETDNDKKNEQNKLSDEELKKYLGYIPNQRTEIEKSVYKNPTSSSNIDQKELLGKTLNDKFAECKSNDSCQSQNTDFLGLDSYVNEEGKPYAFDVISKSEIDKVVMERYNTKLNNLKESTSDYVATYSSCYYYNKGYFFENESCVGHEDYEHLSIIETQEINENDKLVIYEYAALAESDFDDELNKINYIMDYKTSKKTILNDSLENAANYFEEHKKEFTKYKHIFKKNETGYYWVKTETV